MAHAIQQTRPMPQVAFRADAELVARLDRLVDHLQDHPDFDGLDLNRSDILKMLVRRGLDAAEAQYGVKPTRKRKTK